MGGPVGGNPHSIASGGAALETNAGRLGSRAHGLTASGSSAAGACGSAPTIRFTTGPVDGTPCVKPQSTGRSSG